MPSANNPCLTCGACCATYRVSFYWVESAIELGGEVPDELTEELTPFFQCMRGTNQAHPRCIALDGEIGISVRCQTYARRPSPCQEFGFQHLAAGSFAPPDMLERCNQARRRWRLPPVDGLGSIREPDQRPVMEANP